MARQNEGLAMRIFSKIAATFRWKIILVSAVAAMVEGYDLQVVGYVAPVMTQEWDLPPGAFGPTFSIGLVGLMLGCLLIAPLADRYGRTRIIVGSTLTYGTLVFLSAMVDSIDALFWVRFFTGLGLGGALPNITATAAEASPVRWRITTVAIIYCGFGLGSFVGGLVAAALVESYGWQSVFVFGGTASLALVPVLLFGLPRSAPKSASEAIPARRDAIPVRLLFHDGRARFTILLWIIYFTGLMDLYMLASWLPTTISEQGISIGTAALVAGLMQIGGISGALTMSPLVDRYRPSPFLPLAYIFAALCIATIGFAGSSVPLTIAAVMGAGFGIIGGQITSDGVAAKVYPTHIRATGVGWALGIGRMGSILGPFLVGTALAFGVDVRTIFVCSAVPALLAALAYFVMGDLKASEDELVDSGIVA